MASKGTKRNRIRQALKRTELHQRPGLLVEALGEAGANTNLPDEMFREPIPDDDEFAPYVAPVEISTVVRAIERVAKRPVHSRNRFKRSMSEPRPVDPPLPDPKEQASSRENLDIARRSMALLDEQDRETLKQFFSNPRRTAPRRVQAALTRFQEAFDRTSKELIKKPAAPSGPRRKPAEARDDRRA